MKKSILLVFITLFLVSCGGKKKEDTTDAQVPDKLDKYSLIMDVIYEKDDSLAIVYKTGGYFQYEKPVSYAVKGSPELQRVVVDMPSGISVENFQITFSTNKEQKNLTIKNISIKNDNVEVFNGDNLTYGTYFNPNPGFTWNQAGLNYKLNFDGQFPPGQTGNEQLEAILTK